MHKAMVMNKIVLVQVATSSKYCIAFKTETDLILMRSVAKN